MTDRILRANGQGDLIPPRQEALPMMPLPPGVSFERDGVTVCVIPPSPVSAQKRVKMTLVPRLDFKLLHAAFLSAANEKKPMVIYPDPKADVDGWCPKLDRVEELDEDLAALTSKVKIAVGDQEFESLAEAIRECKPGDQIMMLCQETVAPPAPGKEEG